MTINVYQIVEMESLFKLNNVMMVIKKLAMAVIIAKQNVPIVKYAIIIISVKYVRSIFVQYK